jgi:hypothetical protein
MRDLIEDISRHFRRNTEPIPDEVVQGFVRILEDVHLAQMPCSQVFARLDEYVEKELQGRDAARLMPLLREHLDLCPDCCEEYEALLRALAASSELPPSGAP